MSYYLRKALRFGPVRVNLSKHGPGLSLGVKGARAGLTSDGRLYTHAGRYGIYHRQYYGHVAGGEGKTSRVRSAVGPARGRRGRVPGTTSETLSLHVDTGVTYPPADAALSPQSHPQPHAHTLREQLHRPAPRIFGSVFLTVIVACGIMAMALGDSRAAIPVVLVLLAGTLWVATAARARRITQRGDALSTLLQGAWPDARALDPATLQTLLARVRATGATPDDRRYFARITYLAALQAVIRDGTVTPDETACLAQMSDALALSPEFARAARMEVFHEVYMEAVADHELTPAEESTLASVRAGLDIPTTEVADELGVIDRLRTVRTIRGGKLPVVQASVALRPREVCHYEGKGKLLKEKVLGRFQREGTHYKQVGLTVVREGTLIVTDKRLLLVGGGASEFRLDHILTIEVDLDRNVISCTLDGRAHAVQITTPDALEVSAMLAALRAL